MNVLEKLWWSNWKTSACVPSIECLFCCFNPSVWIVAKSTKVPTIPSGSSNSIWLSVWVLSGGLKVTFYGTELKKLFNFFVFVWSLFTWTVVNLILICTFVLVIWSNNCFLYELLENEEVSFMEEKIW